MRTLLYSLKTEYPDVSSGSNDVTTIIWVLFDFKSGRIPEWKIFIKIIVFQLIMLNLYQ